MKLLITMITLLFHTILMPGQTPYTGTFVGHRHFSSALTITFKNDSLFDAKASGCRSWNKGAGKFTIHKKQLTLLFTDSIIPYTVSKTDNNEEADSVNFRITVMDMETHEPLAAGVYCGKGKIGFRPHRVDENGRLDVKVKKVKGEFTIHIDHGGMYSFVSIPVTADKSTDITVYLESKFMVHSGKGMVWNYKIIRHNRRRLIIKDEFGKWKLKKVKDDVDRS